MSIKLSSGFEKGWKKMDSSDPIFCVYFADAKTKEVLFTYGAKLKDKKFFEKYFDDLDKYDHNKLCKYKKTQK